MRKAYNDNGFIVIDGKFIGISLGYDYCSEHEWGIKKLKQRFAIPESSKANMGVKSRTITRNTTLVFKEETKNKEKFAILFTDSNSSWRSKEENEVIPHELKNYFKDLAWNKKYDKEHPPREEKDSIITAWDESSFGIAVMGETEVQYLKELKEAFENINVTIAVTNLRAKNPFAGSALCLLITDRIPQETSDQMYFADKEYYDRIDYEESIGMKKIVDGKRCEGYKKLHYFIACSPKWINYEDAEAREEQKKARNTKYDIMYWVNYSDDDDNCGWYTVEEIREWLTGNKKLTEVKPNEKK